MILKLFGHKTEEESEHWISEMAKWPQLRDRLIEIFMVKVNAIKQEEKELGFVIESLLRHKREANGN